MNRQHHTGLITCYRCKGRGREPDLWSPGRIVGCPACGATGVLAAGRADEVAVGKAGMVAQRGQGSEAQS